MTGSTTVEAPVESAAQIALQNEQAETLKFQRELLTKQAEQQDLLAPFLFKELGLTPQLDEAGEIIGFDKEPESEQDLLRKDIELALLQRSEAALKGELPENPALLRDLEEQRKTLKERLRKDLGTDFATSTPGIEALGDFTERENILLEASRRGDLTTAEALSLGREAAGNASLQQFLSGAGGVAQLPLGTSSALSQLVAGQGGAIAGFQQQQAFQLQARTSTAANAAGTSGALIGAAGGIAAGGLAAVLL